jgi:hypothetical protein
MEETKVAKKETGIKATSEGQGIPVGEGEDRLLRRIYVEQIMSQSGLTPVEVLVVRHAYGIGVEKLGINEITEKTKVSAYKIVDVLESAIQKMTQRAGELNNLDIYLKNKKGR